MSVSPNVVGVSQNCTYASRLACIPPSQLTPIFPSILIHSPSQWSVASGGWESCSTFPMVRLRRGLFRGLNKIQPFWGADSKTTSFFLTISPPPRDEDILYLSSLFHHTTPSKFHHYVPYPSRSSYRPASAQPMDNGSPHRVGPRQRENSVLLLSSLGERHEHDLFVANLRGLCFISLVPFRF